MVKRLRKDTRSRKLSFGKQAELVFKDAVTEAIEKHRLAGNSISTLRDGQVVMIPPEEIPLLQERTETVRINFRRSRVKIKKISRKKIQKKLAAARRFHAL